MKEPISACFTLVQMPEGECHIDGHLTSNEDGIAEKQQWSFSAGRLEDASNPLEWLQMALARACDGI